MVLGCADDARERSDPAWDRDKELSKKMAGHAGLLSHKAQLIEGIDRTQNLWMDRTDLVAARNVATVLIGTCCRRAGTVGAFSARKET